MRAENREEFGRYRGPIKLQITLNYPRPRYHFCLSRADHPVVSPQSGDRWYTRTPDIDNAAKFVLDSMNGIAYADDRLVVDLEVKKRYSNHYQSAVKECGYTVVKVEQLQLH